MSEAQSIPAGNGLVAVPKTLLLDGKTVRRHSVVINGQRFLIHGGPLKFAALEEELFEDLEDPAIAIAGLARCRPRPDIFTFCQRVPETEPDQLPIGYGVARRPADLNLRLLVEPAGQGHDAKHDSEEPEGGRPSA